MEVYQNTYQAIIKVLTYILILEAIGPTSTIYNWIIITSEFNMFLYA